MRRVISVLLVAALLSGCSTVFPNYSAPEAPPVEPIVDHSQPLPDRGAADLLGCVVILPICAYAVFYVATGLAVTAPVWIPMAIINSQRDPELNWEQDYAFEPWRGVYQGGGA